ncbi:MAG: hypothetical protein P8181_13385, partial [bacterium]
MLPIVLLAGIVGCERRSLDAQKEDSPAVVKVNGKTLTMREFELLLPEEYHDVLTADERRDYLDRWITTQLLYEAALQSGLASSPDIDVRLENYKKDLVADRLIQKVIQERAVV